MKKLLFLPLFAMFAMLFSCSTDDDGGATPPPVPATVTSVDYYGVISVGRIADTVRCTVVYDNASNIADITIKAMKFNEAMPAMDMRLAGILCTVASTDILFAVDGPVVPEVAESAEGALSKPGTPDERFSMSGLEGEIKDKTMEFSATMAMGELSFQGTVVPLFAGDMAVVATGSTKAFTVEDVQCEVELNREENCANLMIYGARFAEKMPVTVDIRLESIACSSFHGGYNIAVSDSLVPLVRMAGSNSFVPMPAFAFTLLQGEVLDAGALSFDASMTRGNFSYNGERFIKIVNQ